MVMDNLATHKVAGVREATEAAGHGCGKRHALPRPANCPLPIARKLADDVAGIPSATPRLRLSSPKAAEVAGNPTYA